MSTTLPRRYVGKIVHSQTLWASGQTMELIKIVDTLEDNRIVEARVRIAYDDPSSSLDFKQLATMSPSEHGNNADRLMLAAVAVFKATVNAHNEAWHEASIKARATA